MLYVWLLSLIYFYGHVAAEFRFKNYYESTFPQQMGLNKTHAGSLLAPFNKTRVPGSKGSKEVQEFVIEEFKSMHQNWTLETQNFKENGYEFNNLVFSLGSNYTYLTLAAHYDSKLTPTGFIGGHDSAAPCAMLLYISHFLDHLLTEDYTSVNPILLDDFTGIKIVFFDGEEAFKEWTRTDSLYGSRHLAKKWADDGSLGEMDLFVLLDLLGSEEKIKIPNYRSGSRPFYKTLMQIERKYNKFYKEKHRIFDNSASSNMHISDDQEPFLERGANTLHIIPYPFPKTWHTMDDDFAHLDEKQIHKWCIIMCEFLVNYWNPSSIPLQPFTPLVQSVSGKAES